MPTYCCGTFAPAFIAEGRCKIYTMCLRLTSKVTQTFHCNFLANHGNSSKVAFSVWRFVESSSPSSSHFFSCKIISRLRISNSSSRERFFHSSLVSLVPSSQSSHYRLQTCAFYWSMNTLSCYYIAERVLAAVFLLLLALISFRFARAFRF